MSPNYSSLHEQLLKKIIVGLPKSATKKTVDFVRGFYALSTVNDLEELTPARAVSIALACEKFHATRPKVGPKIAISKAKIEENGRHVTRTQVMVLNSDMPFLVDSLSALFSSLSLSIHLVLHPIIDTARDGKGAISINSKSAKRESLIYVELSPLPSEMSAEDLSHHIERALKHVAAGVEDWASMRERVLVLAEQFTGSKTGISKTDTQEIRDLLLWLAGNHFVFLGLADYRAKGAALTLDTSTALGIYRLDARSTTAIERSPGALAADALSVLKASEFSLVHRHAPMDLVVLKRFDAKGNFLGETRMLGLFTSTVYYRETQNILERGRALHTD